MKRVYLLCCFLLGSLLGNAQNCPPNNLPLELNIPQSTYCANDEVTFSTNVSAINYFWHLGQSVTYATTTPQFTTNYQTGGIYEILLVVGYGNNCQDSTTATLEIVDAAVEFDYTVDENTVFFEADTSTSILNYFWDFGNQLTGSGSSVVTSYPIPGNYPVTLFTSGICPPGSTTQTITILPPTPTEDTPTACGDGIDNDGDGLIDCADSDCACDEDNDGTIASEDPDDNNPCVPDNTVPQCQSTSNPQLFEDYPFLETLIDPNNCNEGKVSLYQQGSFFFLFVETSTSSKLYFQTGQFYCESTATYDCVSAYNLGEAINTWNCSSSRPVDNDGDGVLSDMDPDDNDPCVPNDSPTNCLKDLDNDGVFSDVDPDDNDPCIPNNTATNCTVDTTVIVTPAFFDDFPWLTDLVNTANCNGEKISIYQSGTFSFIYVETQESGVLYFENGTFYCQSAPNFDCVAAYNLSNPYEVWTCTGTPVIDTDNDGTPSETDPDDNDPCVPNDSAANCLKDLDNDGVFSDVDPDDNDPCIPNNTAINCTVDTTVIATPAFFETYPWLVDVVDPTSCDNERISIYDLGSYAFIFVETANSSTLYFETGAFYCANSPSYDCLVAYNLTTPTEVWECDGQVVPPIETPDCDKNKGTIIFVDCENGEEFYMIETDAGLILDIYFDASINFNYYEGQTVKFDFKNADFDSPCSIAAKAVTITCIEEIREAPSEVTPALFEKYTFLYNLVDPSDCSEASVTVYTSGAFDYLLVETATETTLYFQDGTFFCSQTPTYNCVTAYGFNASNITDTWTCGQATFSAEATSRSNTSTFSLEENSAKKWMVNAYPNPAQDHLWIAINSQHAENVQLNLLDKTGRLMIAQSTVVRKGENKLPLTLSGINNGMYYLAVQGQETGKRTIQKIMVVRK